MRVLSSILLLFSTSLLADVAVESRNGFTHPHSEGAIIARYLSENTLTYSVSNFSAQLIGNIYGI